MIDKLLRVELLKCFCVLNELRRKNGKEIRTREIYVASERKR
jgi:hypothetical protein